LPPWGADNFWVTILWTVRIVPYFVLGILLSKHSENIRRLLHRVPGRIRIALIAVPLYIFTIPHHGYLSIRRDALYDFGAAMVIVLALDIPSISAMLNRTVLQWLGRISHSLYLIHTPILLLIFYAFLGRVPFSFIAAAAIVASLTIATLMHRFVEMPAIKLGQRVVRARPLDFP
jgi:peptidoglycan/LPS O-acetylase OafA/YrhL